MYGRRTMKKLEIVQMHDRHCCTNLSFSFCTPPPPFFSRPADFYVAWFILVKTDWVKRNLLPALHIKWGTPHKNKKPIVGGYKISGYKKLKSQSGGTAARPQWRSSRTWHGWGQAWHGPRWDWWPQCRSWCGNHWRWCRLAWCGGYRDRWRGSWRYP